MPTVITIDGVTLTLKKYPEFAAQSPVGTDIFLFSDPTIGDLKKTTMDEFVASIIGSGGGDTNFALDDLTADANRTHTFDEKTCEITFNTITAGGFKISSTSTLANGFSADQKLFHVDLSGDNTNDEATTYAIYASNSHTSGAMGRTSIGIGAVGNTWGIYSIGGNYGVRATASGGIGVEGFGSAIGVRGDGTSFGGNFSTVSGIGVQGISGNNFGVFGSSGNIGGRMEAQLSVVGTLNGVSPVLQLGSLWVAGTVGDGIGGSMDMKMLVSDNTDKLASRLIYQWTDSIVGTRTSSIRLTGVLSAVDVDCQQWNADGSWQIRPITSTEASAITPAEGMIVFTSDTNGTFTSIGFWGYRNGAWAAF